MLRQVKPINCTLQYCSITLCIMHMWNAHRNIRLIVLTNHSCKLRTRLAKLLKINVLNVIASRLIYITQ